MELWPGSILKSSRQLQSCDGGKGLKYISGDALSDGTNCVGPNNQPYPRCVSSGPAVAMYLIEEI